MSSVRSMSDECERLRSELILHKQARNASITDAARAVDDDKRPMYTDDDIREHRLRVHEAAARARAAGCDISDIVGPTVGVGEFEG
jgi:2,4-dienoyl-CoA reductase-like NADH-dependent reductase (Old Yellow Enzyme family)